MKSNFKRIFLYVLGLFIMSVGIAFSVKSDLGVSPVSTIPYTMTLILGIEMGKATIIFHIALILVQILILGKAFKKKDFLQIAVAFMFGYFTTFSNFLMSFVPEITSYPIRLVFLAISIMCVAIGILLYMSSDIVPLAGEGVMAAVSYKFKVPFSKAKIGFDVSMVTISTICCILAIKSLGSVREGTIISAIFVGVMLGVFTRLFKKKILSFMGLNGESIKKEEQQRAVA